MDSTPADDTRSTPRVLNPLWIISLFLGISETTVGVAATQVTGWDQGLFALSATAFPLLVAGAFFAVLWKKPEVFYAPKDFPEHVTVPDFVHGIHRTTPAELGQVGVIVRDMLTSILPGILEPQVSSDAIDAVVGKVVSTARKDLRSRTITIDLRAVRTGVMKVEWIINDEMTVADLLNPLWTSHLYEVAPAFTYPLRWVLVDNRMGTVFDQMGQRWAEAYSMDSDNRSLAEVGIHPGMELAVKISETDHPSRRRRLQPSQRSEHVSYT